MRLILLQYDIDITASQEEKYDFVIKAAKGVIDFNGIKSWINKRVKIK
jgi:death on curing protein